MKKSIKSSEKVNPTVNLILNYILIFMVSAFIGWIWEVSLTFIQHGLIVNRGVLHGPWLPIYGFGGLGIVVLLERFRKHPFLIFSIAALGCGLMEYLTGWYLETFKHLKWWDYGDAFLSLDGRICFLSVFTFGLCGLFMIYFVYPLFTKLFDHIAFKPKQILCFALVLFFLGDFVYSSDVPNTGIGVTSEIESSHNHSEKSV